MTELVESLLRQLTATHDGDPWYGSSRRKLLAGVTPVEARATPVPGAHSIWEQVLHMTSWTREVTRRLEGAAPAEPPEGDWPGPAGTTAQDWEEAQRALDRAHRELIAAIRRQPESRWSERVGLTREPALGTGITVMEMLIGLAQHDAYHTGQIATLRRAAGQL